MKLFRRALILLHRYLGIALSALFVMWFATGIAMMYAREMPRLTAEMRLNRLSPVDLGAVRLTPAEAVQRADWDGAPPRATLLTVMDRPAYRFGGRDSVTVFADTGDLLDTVGADKAKTVASRFMQLPDSQLTYVATLSRPDQWTLQQRMPVHKFTVDDQDATELYVSEHTAEVTVMTTRRSRLLAWIGAIPHWLYFAPLRINGEVWRQVVLWTSGLGIALALFGIVLGIVQLRISRPFRLSRIGSYLPYSGSMRWHYIAGLVFGLFTLTWVFSGWLSMEPWGWATNAGVQGGGLRAAFTGAPGALADFPSFSHPGWSAVSDRAEIKEIEFVRIQDKPVLVVHRQPDEAARTEIRGHQPYFADRSKDPARLLIDAATLQARHEPFSAESLLARVRTALPDTPVIESAMLDAYDSYYYSRDGAAPLPVLRVKLGDDDRTWLYIDPLMSQLVARIHRLDRVERWLYNGMHSLDFAFWYTRRPLWDVGMIALSLGGFTVSALGFYLGLRRLRRGAQRALAAPAIPRDEATRRAAPTRA